MRLDKIVKRQQNNESVMVSSLIITVNRVSSGFVKSVATWHITLISNHKLCAKLKLYVPNFVMCYDMYNAYVLLYIVG